MSGNWARWWARKRWDWVAGLIVLLVDPLNAEDIHLFIYLFGSGTVQGTIVSWQNIFVYLLISWGPSIEQGIWVSFVLARVVDAHCKIQKVSLFFLIYLKKIQLQFYLMAFGKCGFLKWKGIEAEKSQQFLSKSLNFREIFKIIVGFLLNSSYKTFQML